MIQFVTESRSDDNMCVLTFLKVLLLKYILFGSCCLQWLISMLVTMCLRFFSFKYFSCVHSRFLELLVVLICCGGEIHLIPMNGFEESSMDSPNTRTPTGQASNQSQVSSLFTCQTLDSLDTTSMATCMSPHQLVVRCLQENLVRNRGEEQI